MLNYLKWNELLNAQFNLIIFNSIFFHIKPLIEKSAGRRAENVIAIINVAIDNTNNVDNSFLFPNYFGFFFLDAFL